jgi:hypothetical protein
MTAPRATGFRFYLTTDFMLPEAGGSTRPSWRYSQFGKQEPRRKGRGRCAASSGRLVRFASSGQGETREAEAEQRERAGFWDTQGFT